jgi:magnesium chelatase family protein
LNVVVIVEDVAAAPQHSATVPTPPDEKQYLSSSVPASSEAHVWIGLPPHGGVLFMDELGEFPMGVLDVLREPLETGSSTSRATVHVELPARFMLVAATNPCPCGGGPPGAWGATSPS